MRLRIAPEIFHQDKVASRQRQFDVTSVPEVVEVRERYSERTVNARASLVNTAYPRGFVASFGERFFLSETLAQFGKDIEIVARSMERSNRLVHRRDIAVAP